MSRKRFSAKALTERLLEFGGKCAICRMKTGGPAGLEFDHRVPLEMGGEDVLENMEPLCIACHRWKTKNDAAHIAKGRRMQQRDMGVKRQPSRPVPGSRASRLKKKVDGSVVDRETGETIWPRG